MNHQLHTSLRCSIIFALPIALAAGFPDAAQSQPAGKIAEEDPEVAAFFKSKDWSFYPDFRPGLNPDKIVSLRIQKRGDDFAKVPLTLDDYTMIAKSKTVTALHLQSVDCTEEGLKVIAGMRQLVFLVIQGEGVTDAVIKEIAKCREIDGLVLIQTKKVSDAGIKELGTLPKLKELVLLGLKATGSGFASFKELKSLTTLKLKYIEGLSDEGAKHLAQIPNLHHLDISTHRDQKALTSAGIRSIVESRLPAYFQFDDELLDDDLFHLLVKKGLLYGPARPGETGKRHATAADVQVLKLWGKSLTDKAFEAVADCKNARDVDFYYSKVTDASLNKMGEFKRIESLNLAFTKINGSGLDAVTGSPIKKLDLSVCELTEEAFLALGKMTALEELKIGRTGLKGEWLKHIGKLQKLRELRMDATDFDDNAAKHFRPLVSLESLNVEGTKIGDVGLQEILKLPKLKNLSTSSTKVTEAAYRDAKNKLPKLRYYHYGYE